MCPLHSVLHEQDLFVVGSHSRCTGRRSRQQLQQSSEALSEVYAAADNIQRDTSMSCQPAFAARKACKQCALCLHETLASH